MDVAIIGSGVIGLLSALTLTDAGYKVTIIARDLPGDESQAWASPWAGAAIYPCPDSGNESIQTESFKYYWALAHRDPTSGVQVMKATEYFDDRHDDSSIWYKKIVPRYRRLDSDQLPEGAKVGIEYTTMAVNPLVFLPWIKNELESKGVIFVRKTLASIEQAREITRAKVIVHASGLGAFHLAKDRNVEAIRGQTMFIDTDFDELQMHQGSHYTYVIPRMFTQGAIIGGVAQHGAQDSHVDESLRPDILKRVKALTKGRLDSITLEKNARKDIVGFRPGRKGGFRLEVEGDTVHAYGFGHVGYIVSYGVAGKVRDLVDSVVKRASRSRL